MENDTEDSIISHREECSADRRHTLQGRTVIPSSLCRPCFSISVILSSCSRSTAQCDRGIPCTDQ